ncbi:MAG: serine/threonine protein kinase [Polyangiaceae bacterium]|nr:serine/threonine protein kinase [Polyangiaceae bacterium]
MPLLLPRETVLALLVGVNEGDVLAGKYRVEKLLGMGGMGMVVSAHHLQLDERIALKFLLPEALAVPDAVARFVREARAATKIKSEHVVRIIDVGTFDSGEPYMVMEFLQGKDLGEMLRDSGPFAPEAVAEYLLQACEALCEAHVRGIVHRDLKPSNLFLTTRADGTPLVKVLDFGISKITNASSSGPELGLTKTSAMMGSPLYMSPEQMASARDVDHRTDIWALGTIMYELLAGKPPFNADTVPQLCAMVLQQEPAPLHTLRAGLPPAVHSILTRCLRKSPADRYANVAELAVALAELAPKHARTSVRRITRVIQGAGQSVGSTALPPSSDELPPAAASVVVPEEPLAQARSHAGSSTASVTAWSETAPSIPKRSLPLIPIALGVAALGVVGLVAGVAVIYGSRDVAASTAATSEASAGAVIDVPAPEPPPADPQVAPAKADPEAPEPPAAAEPPKPGATGRKTAKLQANPPAQPTTEAKVPPPPTAVVPTVKPPPSTTSGSDLGGRL